METTLYANFTTATKENNYGNDVTIKSADHMLYDPYSGLEEVEQYVYKYRVTYENAGKQSVRFWRGNENTLWNCSCLMKYEDYEAGNNCIKVTGWNENGKIAIYEDSDAENAEITVNSDGLKYNKNANWYYIEDEISTLSGSISNSNIIKNLSYEIKDLNNDIVKQGEINVDEEWIIRDFGLVVGYNDVNIIAEKKNGEIVKKSVCFMNINVNNMENMDVDLNDNDGDGLNNYFESLYGTDINEVDTDGDGLSDFSEIIITGTKPLIQDTDNNGTTDGNEDFDEDGLTNIEEIELGTNCYLEDTDGDKIIDGDEVNKYFTNPLVNDTDEDGLSDYEDIVLQFDPNKADTDENGILDGNEPIEQKYTEKIDTNDKKGVTDVSVSLKCSGYIDNVVSITNTYKLDTRSSDVVGLIGVPVEISCDSEFSTAEITFTYDEKALGETSEDNLCMMWYDEENDNYVLLEDSKVDKENHTITYSTTHFSTYLIVDKKIWLDNMRMDMNYRTYGETINYDVAFVVDTSRSMLGRRITTAKNALNSFTDALLEGDQAGLIKFNSDVYVVQELTSDMDLIKNAINTLSAGGETRADLGISEGITMLDGSTGSNEKIIILICDGDVSYNTTLVQSAKEKEIKIHCINVINGTSTAMAKIAKETGGTYYYAATTESLSKIISKLQGDTVGYVDPTDSDGDGLYDVYEVNGMRLSNGKIVYTDPNKADTDGDGVSDYDAMGGAPVIETYMLNGNTYSCTLNHSKIYGTLPEDFIFVDGTLNTDGQKYYGKMDYIPYSNNFIYDKYENERKVTVFDEERIAVGAAGVYGLYSDKLADMSYLKLAGYASVGTVTAVAIGLRVNAQAGDCLYTYVRGDGGEAKGLAEGSTRKYLYSSNFIDESIFGINSANKYFKTNMAEAVAAAESVLNEYNMEVYLSLSPNKN
ncbi:MAG: VWA domain-containing protein, partial [Lachnospiraceae bacterium]|nr:VWA domain-containing protein [Lachnospiraceae bacterium]